MKARSVPKLMQAVEPKTLNSTKTEYKDSGYAIVLKVLKLFSFAAYPGNKISWI
jgi:hypothetical protein